jgi:hypothetical protein
LFIKVDIILRGAGVISSELTILSTMLWSLWHSETKRHIDHETVLQEFNEGIDGRKD